MSAGAHVLAPSVRFGFNKATITRELIVRLVNTYADLRETKPGTKAFAVATAQFTGLTQGAHFALRAMDISPGSAPFAVEADVIETVRDIGDRPAFTTHNVERKNWTERVTAALLAKWAGDAVLPNHEGAHQ